MTSTLFPYTTLFRSAVRPSYDLLLPGPGRAQAIEDHDDLRDLVHEHHGSESQDAEEGEREQGDDDQQRQDDVLVDDVPSAPGMVERARQQIGRASCR